MIDYSDVLVYSSQPTTCPICGLRGEVILDLSHTNNQVQIYKCPDVKCNNEFIMEIEKDFDN